MKRAAPARARKSRGYHHGDLRQALIDEALVMLRSQDPASLSLRELARRLGVTYGAPHHHFAEKDDLFAAIAEGGFVEIAVRAERRTRESAATDPSSRLRASAEAYLAFAASEPSRYQVMFLPQLRDRKRFTSLHATGGRALSLLEAAFAAAGVPKRRAHGRAVACWALLHGFAQLAHEGFLGATGKALQVLTDEVVTLAIQPH